MVLRSIISNACSKLNTNIVNIEYRLRHYYGLAVKLDLKKAKINYLKIAILLIVDPLQNVYSSKKTFF